METKNVNEAYDELLKKTELTDEQVNEISNVIEEVAGASQTIQDLRDIQNSEHEYTEGETADKVAVVNPNTGKITQLLDDVPYELDDISFEELMDQASKEKIDPATVKVTMEDTIKTLQEQFPNFKMGEITEVMKVVERYKTGEKFGYYNALPESIRKGIDIAIGGENSSKAGSLLKGLKNDVAKNLLDSIIGDAYLNNATVDLNTAIKESLGDISSEFKTPYSDFTLKVKQRFENEYPQIAEAMKEKDPDKAEIVLGVSRSYTQAYTMEDLKDKFKKGKLKVKKIQIEKWKRTCLEFNSKYKDTTHLIKDVSMLLPVLDRHLDRTFDASVIKEFICTFINYTRFMKAENLVDHTFMYFFIENILNLDLYDTNNEQLVKYYNDLLANINEFCEIIVERRNAKED